MCITNAENWRNEFNKISIEVNQDGIDQNGPQIRCLKAKMRTKTLKSSNKSFVIEKELWK